MKLWLLSFVLAAAVVGADMPLTLDPAVIDAAKRAVFNGEPLMESGDKSDATAAVQGDVALWQQAMDAAGTEMMLVRLLALLQRLNPDKPMDVYAAMYADTLRLHVLAAAGNKEARLQLASALRVGVLPNGMRLICDAAKAAELLKY